MAAQHVIGSAGAGVFTPAGFAAALEKWGDEIRPAIVRALKEAGRGPRGLQVLAVEGFISRGVGKGIFGRANTRGNGAFKLIKTGAVETKGNIFVLALELRGFAALQEQGGRTKPHLIEPRKKKVLRLSGGPGTGNRFLMRGATKGVAADLGSFRAAVHHPGSAIPRHPFAANAMQKAAPTIQAAIDNAIVQAGTGIGVRRSAVVRGAA